MISSTHNLYITLKYICMHDTPHTNLHKGKLLMSQNEICFNTYRTCFCSVVWLRGKGEHKYITTMPWLKLSIPKDLLHYTTCLSKVFYILIHDTSNYSCSISVANNSKVKTKWILVQPEHWKHTHKFKLRPIWLVLPKLLKTYMHTHTHKHSNWRHDQLTRVALKTLCTCCRILQCSPGADRGGGMPVTCGAWGEEEEEVGI